MLYPIFKILAALALKIYCKKVHVYFDENTSFSNPKIIASNHPNSFFDAIQIAVHYPQPIYFLARGDAFSKPLIAKFLNALHLIPIYRLSEGKTNLSKNDATFHRCLELLQQNKTILIFSEGVCINEWKLRPLKKGTARLALRALHEEISNLKIQPTNVNYTSFTKNPKEVFIHFNTEFKPKEDVNTNEAAFYNAFNETLKKGILDKMMIQNESKNKLLFSNSKYTLRKIILAVPALVGFILNYGIYSGIKSYALKKTKNTVFYDSVLFGLLLLCYPVIVMLLSVAVAIFIDFKTSLVLFVAFPISGWCYKEFKN